MFQPDGVVNCIKGASRYKLGELLEEVNGFKNQAEGMVRMVSSSQEPVAGKEDEAMSRYGVILAGRLAELVSLQERLQGLRGRYEELGKWFHMEDKNAKKPAEEFFWIWDKFLIDVQQARKALMERVKKQEAMRRTRHSATPPGRRRAMTSTDRDADSRPPRPRARSEARASSRPSTAPLADRNSIGDAKKAAEQ